MSASFEITAASGSYSIVVQTDLFPGLLKESRAAAVITDEYFASALQREGIDAISVKATETAKSLDAVAPVVEEMRRRGVNRKTELLAIGGGVIQDLATFIASIYMRGIAWRYVPTTMLAMVDSCIGGKSSINVGAFKNLVGTFHPPKTVLIDPGLVTTLSNEQRVSGLAEAAKICFCRGQEDFTQYLSSHPNTALTVAAAEEIIVRSLNAKKWFIEIDEFDQAERLTLNFGHTFGHAIEGASHFRISHGVAVALGVLCSLEFQLLSGIDYNCAPGVGNLKSHMNDLLRQVPGLGKELSALPVSEVAKRFESDKKHDLAHYTLILVSGSGKVELQKFPKSAQVRDRMRSSIQTTVDSLIHEI